MTAPTSGLPVVGLDTLFTGFEQAFARWRLVDRPPREPAELFIPLFETLEWAAVIDERLAHIWTPAGERTKFLTWSKDLRGLRWVRHRVHHDWALALEVRTRDELVLNPNVDRASVPEKEWAWREHLPERRRAPHADEAYYKAQLAGRPARVTLNLVRAFFAEYKRLTSPRPPPR